jgi:predicted ATPase
MALYLKSFTLKKAYRDIPPFTIKFREGINVIVGENGSGKSTLLYLIMSSESKDIKEVDYVPSEYRFFDTEKNNPRLKGDLSNSKNIGFDIGSHFVSHGQAMLPLMLASESFRDLSLIIDEPEAGISLSNQKKVLGAIKEAVKNNCQVLIATHSYILIKNADEVFDMDDRKWISSEEYLKRVI